MEKNISILNATSILCIIIFINLKMRYCKLNFFLIGNKYIFLF